jgi:hypothetical protein
MTTTDLRLDPDPWSLAQLRRTLRGGGPVTFVATYLKYLHLQPALIHYFQAPRPLLQVLNPDAAAWVQPVIHPNVHPWLHGLLYCDRLDLVLAEHRLKRVGQAAAPADVLIYLLSAPSDQPSRWQSLLPAAAHLTLQRQLWLDARHRVTFHHLLDCEPRPPTPAETTQLQTLRCRLRTWLLRLERQRLLTATPGPAPLDRAPTVSFREIVTGRVASGG